MLQVSFRRCLSFAPWIRLGSETRFHELQLISSLVTWSHKPLRPENQCSVLNRIPGLLSQWDSPVSLGLHSSWLTFLSIHCVALGHYTHTLHVSFKSKPESLHFFSSCGPGPRVWWDSLRMGSGSWGTEFSTMHICSVPAVPFVT